MLYRGRNTWSICFLFNANLHARTSTVFTKFEADQDYVDYRNLRKRTDELAWFDADIDTDQIHTYIHYVWSLKLPSDCRKSSSAKQKDCQGFAVIILQPPSKLCIENINIQRTIMGTPTDAVDCRFVLTKIFQKSWYFMYFFIFSLLFILSRLCACLSLNGFYTINLNIVNMNSHTRYLHLAQSFIHKVLELFFRNIYTLRRMKGRLNRINGDLFIYKS